VEERQIKLLLIENNPEDVRLIQEMLAQANAARFELECVDRLAAGLVRLASNDIGVVLLDLDLPDSQGLDTFAKAYAQTSRVPIVVLTGVAEEELAIKTVQEGAQDYLVKGQITSDLLVRAIRYAIERKRSEEALRGQALIFDNIHDSIIMTDLMGNIMRWNPAAERLFGYYKDEVFCKTLDVLTTRIINGKLRDGRWAGEMNFTREDGTEVVCETTIIPLCDERGTITAVCGVSHDITKHRQAEEALKRNEALLRATGKMAKIGGWEFDVGTQRQIWTEEVYKIHEVDFDYEPCVSKGLDFYAPASRPVIAEAVQRAIDYGEPFDLELPFITAKGNCLWVHAIGQAQRSNGKTARVFGTFQDITERKLAEQSLQRSYDKLRETLIVTVNTLASTVEMRDPYTAGHQRRVTMLACAIAEEMGLTEEQFDGLRLAGLVHDIGKFNVPVEILNKPGRITETEFNIIKTHPEAGYNVLKKIEFPWPVGRIVLQHHERLDGSGYPQGLKDGGIMLEARILAVADVVEAMASHRPYRPALGIEAALHEITMNKGILYDPDVTDVCARLFIDKGFALGQEM
jgi:PAS domain S-box-containing protein/putative nucleotidyltransferase with HDIG domain